MLWFIINHNKNKNMNKDQKAIVSRLGKKLEKSLKSIYSQSDLNENGGYSHDYTVGYESGFESAMIELMKSFKD